MDLLGYREIGDEGGATPRLRIGALSSRYNLWRGEFPDMPQTEAFWGRDPFEFTELPRVSDNLQILPVGTVDGHNTLRDASILDALAVEKEVPLSPLFVKDLAGRVIYTGFGPERKHNEDWFDYQPPILEGGKVPTERFNPFIPLVVFPKFCRDVRDMEGADLLEQVFLTRFRCLEMSYRVLTYRSGSAEEDLVGATYLGANLYPYKLRLDTFYTDGWKLPQTQMVFALRHEGISPEEARATGEHILQSWNDREPGVRYEDWLANEGGVAQIERWYQRGCTLIPTFEACNGFHVVGREFQLEDYWPGRAVIGLHVVMERRSDKAPAGTILQVVKPGYVTADFVEPAQVIVSDGSGYVSPNVTDPLPLVPNMNLPHTRALCSWNALWIPTHPEHFEAPAIWGWDLTTGRFLQLMGPLWDPLHYFYESVDEVLKAYEHPFSKEDNRWLVPVPEMMKNRFYPVIPMAGFDTFSFSEAKRRRRENVLPRSGLKRVRPDVQSAGVGYHPLPGEFEFEVDPFWFPELHPLNRNQGDCPPDLLPRVAGVISPQVHAQTFLDSVEPVEDAPWLTEAHRYIDPDTGGDPVMNYPILLRYLADDITPEKVVEVASVPYLTAMDELLGAPVDAWWKDLDGNGKDEPAFFDELVPGGGDALWDGRSKGVDLIKFRHLMYQMQLPFYIICWWFGASMEQMQKLMEDLLSQQFIGGVVEGAEVSAAEEVAAGERLQNEVVERLQAERNARVVTPMVMAPEEES